MYNVLLERRVVRELQKLDPKLQKTVKSHLAELAEDPFHSRPGCDVRQLRGFRKPSLYRLRIGDWRAIYAVEGSEVKVTEIFRRRKGYRWLD